jgi:hypothetical protein
MSVSSPGKRKVGAPDSSVAGKGYAAMARRGFNHGAGIYVGRRLKSGSSLMETRNGTQERRGRLP